MRGALASADPDVRLDDLRQLAAGLLERLAREQRAEGDYRRTFGCEHPQHASAIATTRGEAARASEALDATGLVPVASDLYGQILMLTTKGPVPSDTLDAWAKALRSAT